MRLPAAVYLKDKGAIRQRKIFRARMPGKDLGQANADLQLFAGEGVMVEVMERR